MTESRQLLPADHTSTIPLSGKDGNCSLCDRTDGHVFAVDLGYRDGSTGPCKEQSCLLGPGWFTAFLDTARCNRALGIFFGIVLSVLIKSG